MGSPLEARSYSFLYMFIMVIIAVLILLSAVAMVLLKFKSSRKSKEWIEKQKTKETNKENVTNMAHTASLTADEKSLLWKICKRHKARNIEYMYREKNEVTELFKKEFDRMRIMNEDEKTYPVFFSIMYKLEKAREKKLMIASTKSLRVDQAITYYDMKKNAWNLKVFKTDDLGFYLLMPKEIIKREMHPKVLAKVLLFFETSNGMFYKCAARATRYENQADGNCLLFLTHSTEIKAAHKRMAKRMDFNSKCEFSAVKNPRKKMDTEESKRCKGLFLDISATGCKMLCQLPISAGQTIQLYFSMDGTDEHMARGTILATKRLSDEKKFVLQIKFTDIELRTRNLIYARTFGFI